jgi:hypothetical protein
MLAVEVRAKRVETLAQDAAYVVLNISGAFESAFPLPTSHEPVDCSFNAECIWEQGKASKGDGNVEVECAERRYTCTRTLLSRSAPATVFTFDLDTPCSTTDETQRLLQERCMKGMKVDRR